VLRNELCKARYGIRNMRVLNITVSETHTRNMMAHLKRTTAKANAPSVLRTSILVQSSPQRSRRYTVL